MDKTDDGSLPHGRCARFSMLSILLRFPPTSVYSLRDTLRGGKGEPQPHVQLVPVGRSESIKEFAASYLITLFSLAPEDGHLRGRLSANWLAGQTVRRTTYLSPLRIKTRLFPSTAPAASVLNMFHSRIR